MKRRSLNPSIVLFGPILDKVVFTQSLAIGLPTVFYFYLIKSGYNLTAFYLVPPSCCLLFSLVMFCEVTTAWLGTRKRREHRADSPHQADSPHRADLPEEQLPSAGSISSCPRCSFIVAAYLPNEQNLLMETVTHLLDNVTPSRAGVEIIVAYDTPVPLPIEDELRRLSNQRPELHVFHVNGRSKADALNAALPLATGEMICILDADHYPAPDCLQRAWRWLAGGRYDVVQGRNVIRNHATNFLTRAVSVEFECLYGVMHAAKSILADTAHFGGTNGYWRASALKQIRFQHGMQTEDIDATLRALLAGHRIVHDRNIISTELAPDHLRALWLQRKRWTQGWLEAFVQHRVPILQSGVLTLRQKLYWSYLLVNVGVLQLVAAQGLPLEISQRLSSVYATAPVHLYGMFSAVALTFCGLYMAFVATRLRNDVMRYPASNLILYYTAIPFYVVFLNMVLLVALYDHLHRHTQWAVTPRPAGVRGAGQTVTN